MFSLAIFLTIRKGNLFCQLLKYTNLSALCNTGNVAVQNTKASYLYFKSFKPVQKSVQATERTHWGLFILIESGYNYPDTNNCLLRLYIQEMRGKQILSANREGNEADR